jgi:hypothetical protein
VYINKTYKLCDILSLPGKNACVVLLQKDGLSSEDERLAIGFLFGQHRDNPELIDLQITSQFFAEIEQERQTA